MSEQTFTARLSVRGNSVALPLPFDPEALWGARGRQDVCGTIEGHPVRGPLVPDGDSGWCLLLGPAWRRDAGVDIEAPVTATLGPEGPLVAQLAPDLADGLAQSPEARAFFESIAPFYRKNYLRWIDEAKRPETRAARIAQSVAALAAHQLRR